MPLIPIDRVAVGQVLEAPVTNAIGVTLVRPGTPLTPALLARLRDLGYVELDVTRSGEASIHTTAEREALEARFRGHEQDPLMMQLKHLLAGERGRAR